MQIKSNEKIEELLQVCEDNYNYMEEAKSEMRKKDQEVDFYEQKIEKLQKNFDLESKHLKKELNEVRVSKESNENELEYLREMKQ